MKIYTKTGDKGTTSLIGGERVMKNDLRLNAYGTVDELNSFLGLLRAKTAEGKMKELIEDIQNTLFAVGANLATDKSTTKVGDCALVGAEKVEKLEKNIDDFQSCLQSLTSFILYGEDEMSAICHCCRAIARRAEREILSVSQVDTLDDNILRYMNRLSDLLFVMARVYTKNEGGEELFWKK